MGIVIPMAGGMSAAGTIEKNIEGMKSVVIAVVMMSAAQILLHFSKQIVVLAFQFATGAFNFWMRWDGIAFTICSMAGVGFFRHIRHTAKFAVFVYIPTALVMLSIAVLLGYR